MARFILDIATPNDDENWYKDFNKSETFEANIIGQVVSHLQNVGQDIITIHCIDKDNTAQFWEETYRNRLTTKQIKKYNSLLEGEDK